MRKRLWGLTMLTLLASGAAAFWPNPVNDKLPDAGQARAAAPQRYGLAIQVDKEQIYRGDLLLVNEEHPVPQGNAAFEAVNLARHKELMRNFVLKDASVRLSLRLAQQFSNMAEAAGKDRVGGFLLSSGYQDKREQSRKCREKGEDWNLPTVSVEHNLGLAVDIGPIHDDMDRTPESRWLRANAWKYGFIQRYPTDKAAVTGIRYEPWHYRYVGLPHSAIMQEKGLVLEQYMDLLRVKKKLTVTIDRQTYEIFYYPITEDTTLYVPASGIYEISGNNMDGVIVTVSHPVRISTLYPPGAEETSNMLFTGRIEVAQSAQAPGGRKL